MKRPVHCQKLYFVIIHAGRHELVSFRLAPEVHPPSITRDIQEDDLLAHWQGENFAIQLTRTEILWIFFSKEGKGRIGRATVILIFLSRFLQDRTTESTIPSKAYAALFIAREEKRAWFLSLHTPKSCAILAPKPMEK